MSAQKSVQFLLTALFFIFSAAAATAEESVEQAAAQPVMDGLTGGELPWEKTYDEALLDGRDAYNDEALDRARQAFIRAIQTLPREAAGYRNLARTYHWIGSYREATAYYDHYLRLAPDAEDLEVIQQERRATASRSGGELWTLPGDQRMALRSLERELDDGRGLTTGGGGAWGLYRTLMRMGYAEPELAGIRQRLEQKVAVEFEEALIPQDSFLPVLRSGAWELQRERLQALEELARDEDRLEAVRRRALVVDAAESLLGGRYQRAAEKAAQAAAENEDLPFVGWYRAVALEQARRPEQALEALDELLEAQKFSGGALRRVEVLRAQILQQVGRTDEAAQVYRRVLGGAGD